MDDSALLLRLVARVLACLGSTFPWRFPIRAELFDNCLLNIRFILRRLLLLEIGWNVRFGQLGVMSSLGVLGVVNSQAQLLHGTPYLVRLEEVRIGLRDRWLVRPESSLRVLLLRQLQLIKVFERAQERSLLLPVTLRELCVVVVGSGQSWLLRHLAARALLAAFRTLGALVPLKGLLSAAVDGIGF